MNPFQSFRNYEEHIYTLPRQYSSILYSTLIVIRRGKRTALVEGEIIFQAGFRLRVKERISDDNDVVVIDSYGYELWKGEEQLCWYDSQPHPNDETLASTFPHHKHIQPNMRHNRIPAPNISFHQQNIPSLIDEVEALIKTVNY